MLQIHTKTSCDCLQKTHLRKFSCWYVVQITSAVPILQVAHIADSDISVLNINWWRFNTDVWTISILTIGCGATQLFGYILMGQNTGTCIQKYSNRVPFSWHVGQLMVTLYWHFKVNFTNTDTRWKWGLSANSNDTDNQSNIIDYTNL